MENMTGAVKNLCCEINVLTRKLEEAKTEVTREYTINHNLKIDKGYLQRRLDRTNDELICLKNELKRTKRGREILARHEGK